METDLEGSDDDAQGQSKECLLWEKCIQQSIFIDLSEDESLHLSDLERSLVLHVSQAESAASIPSIHLSGKSWSHRCWFNLQFYQILTCHLVLCFSAEHTDLSDITSSESSVNSQSDGVVEVESCMLQPSSQHPNRTSKFDNSGQNTSDEEQEELPYDGDLGTNYSQSFINKISTAVKETVPTSPDGPGLFEPDTGNKDVSGGLVPVQQSPEKKATSAIADMKKKKQESIFIASKQSDCSPPCPSPADFHQLLLRHFPQEDLLQADRLIQAETLPEVSLLESMDDTGYSLVSTHNSASDCEVLKSEEKNSGLEGHGDSKSDVTTDSMTLSSDGSGDSSVVDVPKQEKYGEDQQIPRVPLVRMRSFSDMKYGQGQVHYPLPDFSKIAPKVKIPKVPSGPVRPVPQSVGAMHRTKSSPEILEVISRVLEDSGQMSDRSPPKPAHQLQVKECDYLNVYSFRMTLLSQIKHRSNPTHVNINRF